MGMKKAFTLVEVNLAIVVMAAGVFGMLSLYSLGLRENSQSMEDVASAGFADAVFAPLVAGLSATNLTWQNWCAAVSQVSATEARERNCNGLAPNRGWAGYVRTIDGGKDYLVESGCNGTAQGVFANIINNVPSEFRGSWPSSIDSNYSYGLVATRRGSTISLAFRASRRLQMLLSAPVYYTEVHFQGVRQ